MSMNENEFHREERYIVIKRKRLRGDAERAIRKQLIVFGVPLVDCVVVEKDWPEYETVWKMIQDRVEGRIVEPAQGAAVCDIEYSQFITDVITAAGLLYHGKTDKGLAERISCYAFNLMTSKTRQPSEQPAIDPIYDDNLSLNGEAGGRAGEHQQS